MSNGAQLPARGGRERAGLREVILDAARRVVDERGLRAATTRNIAGEAGCAEGTIYRHFEDKHQLFVELLAGSAPDFLRLIADLPGRAGEGTVRATLSELGVAAVRFYRTVSPLVAGGLADPALRETQRQRFNVPGRGPVHALNQVARYIRAEQELGRAHAECDAMAVAGALLGAAFARAYLASWLGDDVLGEVGDDEHMASVVGALICGLGVAAG